MFEKMPKLSPRTKHFGVPYHWFRSKVSSLEIDMQAGLSADQLLGKTKNDGTEIENQKRKKPMTRK